jgi:uncharacterized Ntn-hydrolase superfamily protein
MKSILVIIILTAAILRLSAQDTFSIVAIDSVTGEVGSAGASCVGSSTTYPHGAAILSDVIPGTGVIHTQAAWNPVNQQYAHDLMMDGLPPQQIIDSLVANDATNNPTTRQYGIADLNGGHPRSAAYTGVNCLDYKNHITGPGYSIQGNILLGQQILDSMEARYLNTPGPLAERLMAALQGAKVIGADTRCAPKGTSSQSSFLRVGKQDDPTDSLYCDLWMAYPSGYPGMFPVDPIDSLQTLFDIWKTSVGIKPGSKPGSGIRVYHAGNSVIVADLTRYSGAGDVAITLMDVTGRVLISQQLSRTITRIETGNRLSHGTYLYRVVDRNGGVAGSGKLIY